MGGSARSLIRAREAFERRDWDSARAGFEEAQSQAALEADDLYALGDCAWWLGDVDEALAAYEGAYRLYLQGKEPRRAATSALGLAVSLFLRGDVEFGSGWMSRAQRLLQGEPEGPEHGLLLFLELESALADGDLDTVLDKARTARVLGDRHADANLSAVGILFEGRARVRRGEVAEGLGLLDEAMVAVLSDDLMPEFAGNIYCHLMDVFHELADIRRASEWVDATTKWLETMPGGALFGGICRVHRSQVLQAKGAWDKAEREAALVCEDLETIHVIAVAEGHYQIGEIRRLRGDLSGAGEAYKKAHERGRDPQPGQALLHLAEGRIEAASASIRSALAAQPNDALARFGLRAAQVEIALAAGAIDEAEQACAELEATEATYKTSGFKAAATRARGAVLLTVASAESALPVLRSACRQWRELGAPYEAACVCLLLARAYDAMGDADASRREREAAADEFERLGAAVALRGQGGLGAKGSLPEGLTPRQVEILALVAEGKSNREIAAELVISQKTVARHLENVFAKLGIASRSAAAAYAVDRRLARGPRG